MSAKLCSIRRISQNGQLVDICFIWTQFTCWNSRSFAAISLCFSAALSEAVLLSTWDTHQQRILPWCFVEDNKWSYDAERTLAGRTHVFFFIFGTHLSNDCTFVTCVDPVFFRGMTYRVLRWNCSARIRNNRTCLPYSHKINCGQSVLNISMMQETVRVGDTAECGTVLWSMLAHTQKWTLQNWYESWTHILNNCHCLIIISSLHFLKHCYELKISI